MSKETCPNCNAVLKFSIMSETSLVGKKTVGFIHKFTDNQSPGFCTKCSSPLITDARSEFKKTWEKTHSDESDCLKDIKKLIDAVPIVTLHNPKDWKYESLEMITSQSVTGTGVFSEIASSWTDFFGMESGKYNKKLKDGEDRCKDQLRWEAVAVGGNAVVGTDIDYSEAGAGKGMLMVCMAGTAVKLKNLSELNYDVDKLGELQEAGIRLKKVKESIDALEPFKNVSDQVY
ncbi:YbjQ family protein [Echinicola soli]|uniref:YbjQ family protein n=1 Tax=Echinicola soli TaxID=2591634 RepID=A0A514CF86_9BACT|nr:heavy metal-binding domain-containing protein [Echinicola soli]QDH78458.1 YbjQ family protein [Echinicola soli]